MAAAKRTWLAVLGAAAIIAGAIAVVLIGGAVYVVHDHTSTQFVDAATADAQIDAERARFAGQEPLIELRGVDVPVVHRQPSAARRDVSVLHVLSYDARTRKLVRMDIPGWLLKFVSAHGSIRLANLELFNDERDRITLEDIERHGPGLIVDAEARSRVLVWTE
jgi:hypothetical protein